MIRSNPELLNYIKNLAEHAPENGLIRRHISAGEMILAPQQHVFNAFIIETGLAKCYLVEDNGNDFIQEFFSEGALFGEIELINDHPAFSYIQAITEMEIYQISKPIFQETLKSDFTFNQLILKALATKVHYKAIRHSFHQSHPIEANLLRLNQELPNFFNLISKPDIASYLGITLRSLNRALSTLKSKGQL